MAGAINAALMKNRFYEQLEHYRRSRPPKEVVSISDQRYQQILEDIPNAKASEDKSDHEFWLLENYDIIKIKETNKLIDPRNNLIYLADGDLFDALHEVHIGVGHVGRSRMSTVLRTRYKNITRNVVELYCELCEQCQQKPVKPKPMPKNITRGQTTLIDFQTNPDGEYNFLLVYQDYLTKFTILKPLKTNSLNEVTFNLLDIFSVFGAPAILSYYNNIDFIKQIIGYFRQFEKFKIIYGNYKCEKDQTYMENIISDITSKIEDWMRQNNASHWSIGLPFIQFMKNKDYNYDILQKPQKALFGKIMKLGLVVNNPSSVSTEEDLEKALRGDDLIEIKHENNKKQPSSSAPNVPNTKKTKKRKKKNNKESTPTQPLFDELTCTDSMSETLAATKSIVESLTESETINETYDTLHAYCNKLPASNAIINTYPVQEISSGGHNVSVTSVMDVNPNLNTIITDIMDSESPLDDNSTLDTSFYSAQEIINNATTDSNMNISREATIVSATPIFQEFDATANNFPTLAQNIDSFTSTKESDLTVPVPELMYNISSSEITTNPFSLEQTIGVYSNTLPVFNAYSTSDSTMNNYAEPILNSDILSQSIVPPCSESFQGTNLILQNSAISVAFPVPSTQSIKTTFPSTQSLGDTIYSFPQPPFTTSTSAESLGNLNFNLPQSITATFPPTQPSGTTNYLVHQPIMDTLPPSQSLPFEDSTFNLPQSNISFLPLTHSIITSTPSTNSLDGSHFNIPQPTITYLSSTPLMGSNNFSAPQPFPFPSNSCQNIDYISTQSNINTLPPSNSLEGFNFTLPQSSISMIPSSLPLKDTNLTFSQSIMTAPSSLQSLSNGHLVIPPSMVATVSASQTLKDLNLLQSTNNMIPTSQTFQNCNFISPQTIINSLPPLQPFGDVNLTLPQSTVALPASQAIDDTNVILSHPIITSHPSSQSFGDTNFHPSQLLNSLESVPHSDINSITPSATNDKYSQTPLADQVIDTSPDLNDNTIQNNVYCSNMEPLVITIPGAETDDQDYSLTESNGDTFTVLESNPNVITQSEPIIIPLPNFESNFFQTLPTLESNYYQ